MYRPRRYRALLSNPNVYRIEDAVRVLDIDPWTTKGKPIGKGDRVLIWKAKGRDPVRGIIALGEVISDPAMLPADDAEF